MDSVKIRELEEKETLNPTDVVVIEDNDGTKVVSILNLQSAIQKAIYFNTVTDMKAATLNEGDIVKTLGYHTVNDGGAATYVVKYAPAEVNDDIFIHYLDTSDTLRAFIVLSDGINPIQAGAYGDGVHNDYSVLNKIINSKKDTGVIFPRNRIFYIGENTYLKIPSNSNIDFNNTTIKGSGGLQVGLAESISNAIIRNINIEKGSIRIDNSSNIHIINSIFKDGDKCIHIASGANIHIDGCSFIDSTTPIYVAECDDIFISKCSIESAETGIDISTYSTNSTWANSVNIERCTIDATTAIKIGSAKKYISIANCALNAKKSIIQLNPRTSVQLSVSNLSAIMNDGCKMINMDGGVDTITTISLSGIISVTSSGKVYLFNSGAATIINHASYRFKNTGIYLGLTYGNNKVNSGELSYSNKQPIEKGADSSGLLDLGYYDGKLTYPLFDFPIMVNSNAVISNITTVDDDHKTQAGAKGYIGQILTLYSNSNTVLKLNSANNNVKKLGSLDTQITLQRSAPVKIKYNGSYWYIIEC